MKSQEKPSVSPEATNRSKRIIPDKLDQGEPRTRDGRNRKIDSPGFDLGGSSGDTHAATGLGLGNDAFDKLGNRRLPGRRLDNKLITPRGGGPVPRATDGSRKILSVLQTPSTEQPKSGD